jgi:hypothetical protein
LILCNIIIIITMARQPYMGLGLLFPRLRGLCAFAAVRDRPTAASKEHSFLEMLGNTNPAIQCHNPEDLDPIK